MPTTPRHACVALVSGGLDSLLAARLMAEQGIRVHGLTFATNFGCGSDEGGSCGHPPAEDSGHPLISFKMCSLGQAYIDMVLHPRFGYGKNMNPCMDCRGMMLTQAEEYRRILGADFLVTGEVLGQRPFSQRRLAMSQVEEQAGLTGLVLRPLSAKLLPPTRAELEGIVDRERLLDIRGRSRQRQMALALELGLAVYPSPAGGCLLTDPQFVARFRNLLANQPAPRGEDVELIKYGRIFQVAPGVRLFIGRNEAENLQLQRLARGGDLLLELAEYPGPLALLRGPYPRERLGEITGLLTRYAHKAPQVAGLMVRVAGPGDEAVDLVPSGPVPDQAELDPARVARA